MQPFVRRFQKGDDHDDRRPRSGAALEAIERSTRAATAQGRGLQFSGLRLITLRRSTFSARASSGVDLFRAWLILVAQRGAQRAQKIGTGGVPVTRDGVFSRSLEDFIFRSCDR